MKEHLHVYAALRGVPPNDVDRYILRMYLMGKKMKKKLILFYVPLQ